MIQVKEISKFFGKKPVIQDVSVDVAPGKLRLLSDRMVQVNQHCFQW